MRRESIEVRVAASRAELDGHMGVRQRVFVEEQRLFSESDRDIWDDGAIHAVAVERRGDVVGAVRFYALDEAGLWKGDRLAVLSGSRPLRVGAQLVRFAVATAAVLGGTTMLARVQVPSVAFFTRLGWEPVGSPAPYRGALHQRMTIGLVDASAAAPASYAWAYGS